MRSRINHTMNHPARAIVKALALAVLLCLCVHAAYAQGVRHAIENACPYVDGASIMIDFNGQVHEYR